MEPLFGGVIVSVYWVCGMAVNVADIVLLLSMVTGKGMVVPVASPVQPANW